MFIPADEQGVARNSQGVLLGIDEKAKEKNAYLARQRALFREPSWVFGVGLPLVVLIGAVYFGFVKQDMLVPFLSAGRLSRGSWAVQGTAAVWAGVSSIGLAATLHGLFFWAPRPRFRSYAYVVAALGALLFLGAMAVAGVEQKNVAARRRQEWRSVRQSGEHVLLRDRRSRE